MEGGVPPTLYDPYSIFCILSRSADYDYPLSFARVKFLQAGDSDIDSDLSMGIICKNCPVTDDSNFSLRQEENPEC